MKKYQKILIVIGIVIVVLVPAILFLNFLFWKGSPKEILSVADQFQPPASWELVSENVRAPQTLCWDGGGCPYVNRGWHYSDVFTYDEFKTHLEQTDWQYTFDDRCKTMGTANESHLSNVCVVELSTNDFDGSIYISNDDKHTASDTQYTLSLSLGPK